jgi:nucleotidyltransferase substrate binding protein (TIGR01987 family)
MADAERALERFNEIQEWDLSDPVYRDSAIKRFELAFETMLRALQAHLAERAGIVEAASKRIIRGALDARLLSAAEVERTLEMANDRNLSTHTYRELAAVELASRLPDHRVLMGTILDRLRREGSRAK